MPTEMTSPELTPTESAINAHVQRLSGSMAHLNARIARLASALNVTLEHDSDVERLLHREEHPSTDARERRMREELRGLLVLRYSVTKSYTEKLGADVTRDLLVYAEERLLRQGFDPGADGIDLQALERLQNADDA